MRLMATMTSWAAPRAPSAWAIIMFLLVRLVGRLGDQIVPPSDPLGSQLTATGLAVVGAIMVFHMMRDRQ